MNETQPTSLEQSSNQTKDNTTTLDGLAPQWRFWIDRGGTFTDIVAVTPDGQLLTHKLLSEHPSAYADAAIEGIRVLQARCAQFSPHISEVKMGTTVATNALLERKGDNTLL
ncbi:MAG: hydantoinase/oxoprolinase N-terminal domain-containing protein, partial [Oleibacter sp.]|nr:hydantoinase/oxoprolinase N-terminal domain-containing protein [Thalassolituus sp.]